MIKLYIGDFYYDSNYRSYLVDILKPFFPEKNLKKYHLTHIAFEIIQNRNESNYFLLPFSWNYYVETNTTSIANKFIIEAQKNDKKILIWVTGDFYYTLPQFDNVIGLYTSPYLSKQNIMTIPLPVFIRDPLQSVGKDNIFVRDYSQIPSIGFCGQVDPNLTISMLKMCWRGWRNMKYYLSISKHYSGPSSPPTYVRKKVLEILEKTDGINTDFIRRNKYQGGKSKTENSFENLRKEFYCNINNTDYTLCIRGTGNFSARFYETLALGRTPIFINTDCILPFNEVIEWKKHIIWIEQNEISDIDLKILEFHNGLKQDSFTNLQDNNRQLWEEYFSFPGFIQQFTSYLKKELN